MHVTAHEKDRGANLCEAFLFSRAIFVNDYSGFPGLCENRAKLKVLVDPSFAFRNLREYGDTRRRVSVTTRLVKKAPSSYARDSGRGGASARYFKNSAMLVLEEVGAMAVECCVASSPRTRRGKDVGRRPHTVVIGRNETSVRRSECTLVDAKACAHRRRSSLSLALSLARATVAVSVFWGELHSGILRRGNNKAENWVSS
ncbi:hypothetical protein HPB51_012947 [Rhipicephalus microplus]|uniref:Uncharacterized protein n=1 Tax=Rhipicephalus microplus TaxID=6941 RepID=A0A9J6F2L7_RHIMP|nr:hypothetical protein HPB51_012947 [Rhipicephalus microplus]